jgi:hypothetical protein
MDESLPGRQGDAGPAIFRECNAKAHRMREGETADGGEEGYLVSRLFSPDPAYCPLALSAAFSTSLRPDDLSRQRMNSVIPTRAVLSCRSEQTHGYIEVSLAEMFRCCN